MHGDVSRGRLIMGGNGVIVNTLFDKHPPHMIRELKISSLLIFSTTARTLKTMMERNDT